ncbi:ABC transporter [Streptomyces sp. NPDC001941]|uniref:ABC transporter n=1 Tax=Streptomyces sp. NPDC001941 TaxID=3154659 RepID=UPI00332954C1
MTALLRYHLALLLRSQRWLPPALLYTAAVAVGVQAGDPVLGSLGFAVAGLVPATVWLVRICLDQEPPAARAVVAAASGRSRAHVAAVLGAVCCMTLLGAMAVCAVTWLGAPVDDHREIAVARVPAALAGLLAALVCVLVGAAVGTLCARPLVRARGWSVATALAGAVLALVVPGSPAGAAVTDLVTGSRAGTVPLSLLPLAGAVALAAGALAVACRVGERRGE